MKVHMATFGFLFLPRHMYEWTLHVAINDFCSSTRTASYLFFVRWISFDAAAYLLQTTIFHHLLGNITVLDIFKETMHCGAVYGYKRKPIRSNILYKGRFQLTLTILFAHLWGKLFIPIDHVVVEQNNDMAFAIAALRRGNHQRQYEILEKDLELLTGALITQFVEQASFCVLENQHRRSEVSRHVKKKGRESKAARHKLRDAVPSVCNSHNILT